MAAEKGFHTTLGHVVVTGGCGFLGHNIVKLILEQYPKSSVSALDVRTTNRVDSAKVSYHTCDITDGLALNELFQKLKPDVVIHTAAIIPDRTSNAVVYKVNVDGTRNLLEAAKNAEVKAFVYTSSSSVIIGNVDQVINADESWPLLVGNDQPEFYSRTKVCVS
jgi:sterol-4alpha-carboxylate 3-dehydrogenase (decarboxylating)